MPERGLQITFDAADPHSLAAWWSELVGYEVLDGHELVSELLAAGVVTDEDTVSIDGRLQFADAAVIEDPAARGPRLFFQRVPETKRGKNRVHLDVPVAAEDLDTEVERQVARGAQLVGFDSHPGHRWAVMQDPEGNEFCLH